MQNNYIILSNSNSLVRVSSEDLVCVTSDGSYSTMVLTDGTQHTFSFNLHHFETIIQEQLGNNAHRFIRLGKSLIINSSYIYLIHIPNQEIVLSDKCMKEKITLKASKEALKALKNLLEISLNKKRINL